MKVSRSPWTYTGLDFLRRSRRCSRGRDEDTSRFVYGRYRQPTSRSPYGNHQHTHQHSHQMHPEDEGIYETADPDRGSNTRGETPDCERYCKTLRHEKSYGFTSSNYSLSPRHVIGLLTPSITNPTITHIYLR